jgi:putative nucleotidyltransferase with HDIG domain
MNDTRLLQVSELREGMRCAENIYVGERADMVIAREGQELCPRMILHMHRHQVKVVRVFYEQKPEQPPQHHAPPPLPQAQPRPQPAAAAAPKSEVKSMLGDAARREAVESVDNMFALLHAPGEVVKMTTAYTTLRGFEKALNAVVAAVTADPTGLIHIHDLKSYDEYTYHHSMSVAMLSVATGQAMGMGASELMRLCRAATLHDIGKQSVDHRIINKSGKLTDAEYIEIQEHAANGATLLKAKGMGDQEIWNAVKFHHEKVDGSGYPNGLRSSEIPPFSRIIAVADVYDAITSYRPYRRPMMPADAYEIICSEVGRSFDYDVVAAFASRLDLYPIGTVLTLSTGETGTVLDNSNVQRPILRTHDACNVINLADMNNLSVIITDMQR